MLQRLKFDLDDLSTGILNKLDQSLFERTDTTFLDPSMAGGQFLKAIESRLLAFGHSEENISRRVFGLAENVLDIGFVKNKHKLLARVEVADFATRKDDMKFDVILMNPPYNSVDTSREKTAHRGQGDNISKQFTLRGLESLTKDGVLASVMPYGQRTYSNKVAGKYVECGLYKVEDASNFFPQVSTNPCVFFFDKKKKVADVSQVDDQYKGHDFDIPDRNLGDIFKNQPGCLNRVDYEHMLTESGKYRIAVTTSIQKYTDDQSIVDGLADPTVGNWRVVMNCTTVRGGWGKMIVESPNTHLSKSVHALICSSEEEANDLRDYLGTERVIEILAQVKLNACNSKKFLQFIPLPDNHTSTV
jgi:hypothetical protein